MKRAMRVILVLAIVVAPIAGVARANGPEAAGALDPPCCPFTLLEDQIEFLSQIVSETVWVGGESLCAYYRTAPGGSQHSACAPMQVSALTCPHLGRICDPPPGTNTANNRH